MSKPISTKEIGAKVIELLGLPKLTREVHLHFVAGEIVKIDAAYYPDRESAMGLLEVLSKHYELREKSDTAALPHDNKGAPQ